MRGVAVRVLRSGWTPAAWVTLLGVVMLLRYDTPLREIVRYATWLLYGAVVPGTLLWRAFRGKPRSFVEDVTGGTAVGIALQVLLYIMFRAMEAPMLITLYPLAIIVPFAYHPPLRKYWRSGKEPMPLGWAWAISICTALVFVWIAVQFFPAHPLQGPGIGLPYVDLPYHQALAAEVKHHMPPTWPHVLGEPLRHHWFPHAQMAASSWATGLELQVILLRLQIFPLLAITIVGTALLGSRITRRGWPGPVAVIIAWFGSTVSPFLWAGKTFTVFDDQRLLSDYQWQSPTHLFGAALLAPVALLIVDRLRGRGGNAGQWALIAILLEAAMGSKATILPLLLAGLAFVGIAEFVTRRRLGPTVLVGGFISVSLLLFSTFVLYGGSAYGMQLQPFAYIRRLGIVGQLGLTPPGTGGASLPIATVTLLTLLALIAGLMRGAGMLGLFQRRRIDALDHDASPPQAEPPRRDRSLTFLGGMVVGGYAIVLLFHHPGLSQLYFLRSAFPFIGVLAAAGLASLIPADRRTGPVLVSLGVAAAIGAIFTAALTTVSGKTTPTQDLLGSRAAALGQAARPFLAIACLCIQAAVLFGLARRRDAALRGVGAALVLTIAAGTALPGTLNEFVDVTRAAGRDTGANAAAALIKNASAKPQVRTIPAEAIGAARWLRAHSTPDEIVATNTHCRYLEGGFCDNRHFWIAAYTERRILVEGWGYTSYTLAGGRSGKETFFVAGFQDPERLRDNDEAFRDPSPQTIGLLRDLYGVRWLFVDERYDRPAPTLKRYAKLMYRAGPCAVYRI